MILIGADFVPTKSNEAYFIAGDSEKLFGEALKKLLDGADYRIFNLECPLVDKETPIAKKGPHLRASTKTVQGFRAAGVDLLTLANNHIMDQGESGLHSTLHVLENAGIKSVGSGACLSQASNAFTFSVKGKRMGVYACAEHEFSIATDTACGANPFDPLETPDHIAALKQETDFVIVLYHGGKEYYRYPSPNLQKRCRKMISKGADLVICQHSHCIGCAENYLDGTIVYGQGNFLFDHGDNEFRNTSLLVGVDDDLTVSFFPLQKKGETVRLAGKAEADEIMSAFNKRSEQLNDPKLLKAEYEKFAVDSMNKYLRDINGKGSAVTRFFNKLTGGKLRPFLINRRFGRPQLLALQNFLECEAHNELFACGIKKKIAGETDKS